MKHENAQAPAADEGRLEAPVGQQRGDLERECAAVDELLRVLGLDPDQCRTEGGAINMARTRTLLREQTTDDKRLLRELFAVCEATEDECADADDNFKRGRAFEAKRIRRGVGTWYQDEFCGRSFMGEPCVSGAGAERASESDSRHPANGDPYTTGPSHAA